MARQKRINLAGYVYHVICGTDQDDVVFTEDKDKERFLEWVHVAILSLYSMANWLHHGVILYKNPLFLWILAFSGVWRVGMKEK